MPESPASSAGDDTAAWLVKDPAPHSATEGEEDVLVVSDALLRTRDAAKLAARAIVEASKRATMRGDLKLVGRADIGWGRRSSSRTSRSADVDGLYAVRSVQHVLGGNAGFVTPLGIARGGDVTATPDIVELIRAVVRNELGTMHVTELGVVSKARPHASAATRTTTSAT